MQICPILNLALLLLKYPFNGNRVNGKLIPRNNFKTNLNKLFKAKKCQCGGLHEEGQECFCRMSAVDKRRAVFIKELVDEGFSYEQIGTHSWRKGAASFSASGTTAAPSIVSICIRAGWKISNVLKRYLSMENAGDWFLGRVVTGLPIYDKKFSVLPPRFKPNMTADDKAFVNRILNTVYPNPTKWGEHMLPIFHHLLASVAWHKDYLQSLTNEHFWRSSYLSNNPLELDRLHSLVELVYSGDDPTHRYEGGGIAGWLGGLGWRKNINNSCINVGAAASHHGVCLPLSCMKSKRPFLNYLKKW